MEFIPYSKDGDVSRRQRNLPHWEQSGKTYFVTFRLADSIPKSKLEHWVAEKSEWEKHHPSPWSDGEWKVYREEFLERIERWSDRGYGDCCLRDPDIGRIVAEALWFFDSNHGTKDSRYEMGNFVIMPNHVHLLVRPLQNWDLGKLIHSWKSFSAHEINKRLGRDGSLWMDERFDHLVRSFELLQVFQRYIAENPTKAGLRPGRYTLHQP